MKKTLRHLRLLASIASFALFVYVLQRSGPEAVLDKIRLLGWGFVILIVLSGARQSLAGGGLELLRSNRRAAPSGA